MYSQLSHIVFQLRNIAFKGKGGGKGGGRGKNGGQKNASDAQWQEWQKMDDEVFLLCLSCVVKMNDLA